MQRISLTGLQTPTDRRWEHKGQPFPAEGIVLRQSGNVVAASPVESGAPGVGVWDTGTGELLFWDAWPDAVRFLRAGMLVARDERVVLLSWPAMTEIESVEAPDQAETFVVSPSEKLLVVHQNDGQGMNGYEVFSLDPLRKVSDHIGLHEEPMYAMPAISPDERLVACSPGNGYFWVPDEDAWPGDWDGDEAEIPSPGGLILFGHLLVHDLRTDAVTRHELRFDLEPGWVPADCWDGRWEYGAIGLEFLTDERIRLQLPDGVWVELTLPLPDSVLLPTPDRTLQPSAESS